MTQEESLKAARAMTSAERVESMAHGLVDNDILTVEIEHRTGIDQQTAEIVTIYELQHQHDVVYIDELAREIGDLKESPDPETKGIENVSYETALRILWAEDEIFWDCGINREI